jgi:hypothetical protein
MKRSSTLGMTTLAFLCLGIVLPASNAISQQKTIKEQIVGTWLLDSVYDHIERSTFPGWDGIDRIVSTVFPTENELNIIGVTPINPTLGPFIPHLNFKRAM